MRYEGTAIYTVEVKFCIDEDSIGWGESAGELTKDDAENELFALGNIDELSNAGHMLDYDTDKAELTDIRWKEDDE